MDVASANASLDDDYGDNHGASAPAIHHLALFKDDSYAIELTNTAGIDRIPITNDSTNWPDAVDAIKANGAVLTSDASTDVWPYDATAWALMDAATGGNRGDGDSCDPISNDEVGTVITIDDGALTISYDTD